MPRSQARILVSIWSDPDFLQLPPEPQRLYLFLLSQPNLNHAGLLPLTVKRWARAATALSTTDVENSLDRLEQDRFIVVDEDTEEVLVRTLVKNDGVWRQPKVMPAMAADAAEIMSAKLRWHLRKELETISLDELKDETRAVVEPVLLRLLDTLPDTAPDTVFGARELDFDSLTDTPTRVTRAAPAPASTSATDLVPRTASHAAQDDPTAVLLAEHNAAYDGKCPPSALAQVKPAIMQQVAEGTHPDLIRAGLARMREKQLGPALLPQLVAESLPTRRPSTTDNAVAQGLALVEKFSQQENAS